MSDTNNVESATVSQPYEMKSTDTSSRATHVTEQAQVEVKKEPVQADVPSEGDDDAPEADASSKKKGDRLPRWMQERLERAKEQGRREALEQQLANKSDKAEPEKKKDPKEQVKTLEDFDFDTGAYTEYLVEKRLEARDKEAKAKSDSEAREKQESDFKKRVDDFESRVGDGSWQEIVESPINKDAKFKPMTDLFSDSDKMLEIAHFLATNEDEANRIVELPRAKMVVEMGKLIDRFEGGAEQKAPIPEKKVTKANPPPKTISGTGVAKVDVNDPSMTTAQRINVWKQQNRR